MNISKLNHACKLPFVPPEEPEFLNLYSERKTSLKLSIRVNLYVRVFKIFQQIKIAALNSIKHKGRLCMCKDGLCKYDNNTDYGRSAILTTSFMSFTVLNSNDLRISGGISSMISFLFASGKIIFLSPAL